MAETMHEKMMRLHTADSNNKSGQSKLLSYDVALKGKKQVAERTYAFTFEKLKDFQFTAGQHVRMTLINPPETDDEGDSRFLSLVSTPQDKDLVIAMRMRDTAFKRVLSKLPVGTKVRIQMRQHAHAGAFILHDDASRSAVFIVGGIGIVPAYSMIKDALERNLPYKLILFYSNRRPEDAPFLSELQRLTKQYANFTFVPTMTEPENSATKWSGQTGRINQVTLNQFVKHSSQPIYYVSGLSEMVGAMKTLLKQAGVGDEDIRTEEFAGFTMSHRNENGVLRRK